MSVRWIRVDGNTPNTGHVATFLPETTFQKFVVQQDDVDQFSVRGVVGTSFYIVDWGYPTREAALAALKSILDSVDILGLHSNSVAANR